MLPAAWHELTAQLDAITGLTSAEKVFAAPLQSGVFGAGGLSSLDLEQAIKITSRQMPAIKVFLIIVCFNE